jgi:diacylglycerol kinase family enzyme
VGYAAFPRGGRLGALAKAVDREDPKRGKRERVERGRQAFAKAIADAEPRQFSAFADGDEIDENFLFVEILNLGMTGPRMLIGPSAHPDDQLLDVVYLTAAGRQEMLDWLGDGPDDRPAPVHIRKARKATLNWKDGPLRIDDQVLDPSELACNIIVEIEPDGLPSASQMEAISA